MRKVSDCVGTVGLAGGRLGWQHDAPDVGLDQRRDLYYDASWRLIHEEIYGNFHQRARRWPTARAEEARRDIVQPRTHLSGVPEVARHNRTRTWGIVATPGSSQ